VLCNAGNNRELGSELPNWAQENAGKAGFDNGGRLSYNMPTFMRHTVTLLPGDGIGPEVSDAVRRIIQASGVEIDWEVLSRPLAPSDDPGGQPGEFPFAEVISSVQRNRTALKGPMATGVVEGPPSINVALRKTLNLYANLRPVRNMEGVDSRWTGVDLIIVRENTEDLYAGLEHTVIPGVVESLKIITEKASTDIARFAFSYARRRGRKRIHAIHKANIMKLSDGLFLSSARRVAAEYADIEYHEMIVDNTCMQMVLNPSQFDVLLLPNLYGDVVSDLAAGLVGGLGMVPSGNLGADAALFEAVHGTAPDIAGKGIANPTALLLSSLMMLRHLNEREASQRIDDALRRVYREGRYLTRDVGGKASTSEFTDAVIAALDKK